MHSKGPSSVQQSYLFVGLSLAGWGQRWWEGQAVMQGWEEWLQFQSYVAQLLSEFPPVVRALAVSAKTFSRKSVSHRFLLGAR